MEKILTNYQVEWLSNIKLLSEYEDGYYEKDEMSEKTSNFIENNYPGEEENIMEEFKVLKQKGLINFNTSVNQFGSIVIEEVGMTKAGIDYLTILEAESKKNPNSDEIKLKIKQEVLKSKEKSLVDKVEQVTTIMASLGTMAQWVIPHIVKGLNF